MDLAAVLETLQALPPALVYGILFGAALIEYVVPPFPGDAVVLAGSLLVGAFGWPAWAVLGTVTAGALVGALIDYEVGRWLMRSGRMERMGPKKRRAIDGLVVRFRRHGPIYLAVNRFFPGVRAFFFIAAGLAGLKRGPVMLWSGVSALAWNLLLVGIGTAVGHELETVERILSQYATVAWVVVGSLILFFGIRAWRRRDAPDDAIEPDESERGGEGSPMDSTTESDVNNRSPASDQK